MASFTVPCPKTASSSLSRISSVAKNSPRIASPNATLSFGLQGRNTRLSVVQKVQSKLNKVTPASSSNSVAIPSVQPMVESSKEESPNEIVECNKVPDPETIAAFMAQVSDLVKLVDSRDIVELKLKQLNCEVTIRKKEALEKPVVPQASYGPVLTPFPHAMYTTPSPGLAGPPASPAPPALSPPPSPAAAVATKSSHPPLKSPMAGTFYQSPGPGEPPFVKVGDKVQKGQVICIVEAMKLMNEIEADRSGTIAEIVAEDGKPVSVDTPLFVIAP